MTTEIKGNCTLSGSTQVGAIVAPSLVEITQITAGTTTDTESTPPNDQVTGFASSPIAGSMFSPTTFGSANGNSMNGYACPAFFTHFNGTVNILTLIIEHGGDTFAQGDLLTIDIPGIVTSTGAGATGFEADAQSLYATWEWIVPPGFGYNIMVDSTAYSVTTTWA